MIYDIVISDQAEIDLRGIFEYIVAHGCHSLMLHHRGHQKWRAECLNPWLFPYIWLNYMAYMKALQSEDITYHVPHFD